MLRCPSLRGASGSAWRVSGFFTDWNFWIIFGFFSDLLLLHWAEWEWGNPSTNSCWIDVFWLLLNKAWFFVWFLIFFLLVTTRFWGAKSTKVKWFYNKFRSNLFCSAKNLFCSVNFFPAKIFSGILEKGNLSEQKKILAGKNSLSKKGYPKRKKRIL
jgi:hypothetical protein